MYKSFLIKNWHECDERTFGGCFAMLDARMAGLGAVPVHTEDCEGGVLYTVELTGAPTVEQMLSVFNEIGIEVKGDDHGNEDEDIYVL